MLHMRSPGPHGCGVSLHRRPAADCVRHGDRSAPTARHAHAVLRNQNRPEQPRWAARTPLPLAASRPSPPRTAMSARPMAAKRTRRSGIGELERVAGSWVIGKPDLSPPLVCVGALPSASGAWPARLPDACNGEVQFRTTSPTGRARGRHNSGKLVRRVCIFCKRNRVSGSALHDPRVRCGRESEAVGSARLTHWTCVWPSALRSPEERRSLHKGWGLPPVAGNERSDQPGDLEG